MRSSPNPAGAQFRDTLVLAHFTGSEEERLKTDEDAIPIQQPVLFGWNTEPLGASF